MRQIKATKTDFNCDIRVKLYNLAFVELGWWCGNVLQSQQDTRVGIDHAQCDVLPDINKVLEYARSMQVSIYLRTDFLHAYDVWYAQQLGLNRMKVDTAIPEQTIRASMACMLTT